MISPIVSGIAPSYNIYSRVSSKNNIKNKSEKINCQNQYFNNFSKINFAGFLYQKPQMDFKDTISQNYFQLPKVTLKNGNQYQLLPDESQISAAKELYKGNSLLYSVSTGTGKTAVAHWLITKNLNGNKKTVFTVPTKALANDKYDEFCEVYGKDKVGVLTGDRKINSNSPVLIMTTEIYDKQVESGMLNSKNTGSVIYDEAHYISDEERGDAWESSIIESSKRDIQILLLSATIGNCEKFRGWIESLNKNRLVKKIEVSPEERYVPQIFYSYFGGKFTPLSDGKINLEEPFSKRQNRALETIYRIKNNKDIDYQFTQEDYDKILSELKQNVQKEGFKPENISLNDLRTVLKNNYSYLSKDETEGVTYLLLKPENKITKKFHNLHQSDNYTQLVEDMKENNMLPAIIYRLSKRKCEDTAKSLATIQPELNLTTEKEKKEIKKIINKYQREGKYLGIFSDEEKEKLIKGIGVHHSSKSPEYKALVEELFRKKLLKVVVATSTLGVGIDMPAKSTVVSDMSYMEVDSDTQEFVRKPVTINEFYQMVGRAGRRGQDPVGNVIIYNPYNSSSNSKDEKTNTESINEEALIQRYLISKPDDLSSAFKPSVSALAKYYTENETQNGFRDIASDTFKTYLSENPEAETLKLVKQFRICTNILLKEGYVYKCNNEYFITPKGKILSLSQCSNPLMLASLLCDKNIEDISTQELCQIAGYIAGSQIVPDINQTPEFKTALSNRINGIQKEIEAQKQENIFSKESGYENAGAIFRKKEKSVLKSVLASNVDFNGKAYSNEYSGYVAYCWAILNQHSKNPIANFNKILTYSIPNEKETTKNIFKAKASEGNNYKIIAQSISILKQMRFICEYALENEDDFPEVEYWQSLKEKCEEAIELMNKPPIEEFSEEESLAYKEARNLPVNICPICTEPMADADKAQKYAKEMLSKSGIDAKDYIQKGIEAGYLHPTIQLKEDESELSSDKVALKALRVISNATQQHPDFNVRGVISLLAEQYLVEIKLNKIYMLEEIARYLKTTITNAILRESMLYEIQKDIDSLYDEQNCDILDNKNLNELLKKFLERTDDGKEIYNELLEIQKEFPDDEIANFFINLDKQTNDSIASVFANKRNSAVMKINLGENSSNESLDDYIKTCAPCKEKRRDMEFNAWSSGIPNVRNNFKNYFRQIKLNMPRSPYKKAKYEEYIKNTKTKLGKI